MVSFVIVNYNGEEYLGDCINSILKQTIEKEIIIVDNNSSDNSIDIIKKFPVRLIQSSKNMGYPLAVNKGVRVAKGDIVFLLNPTSILKEDISQIISVVESEEAIVVPKLVDNQGKLIHSIRNIPTDLDFLLLFTGLSFVFKKSSILNRWKYIDFDYTKEQYAPQPMSCALILRRKLFDNIVGLFDTNFFLYFSDVDFARRLRDNHIKIRYIPSVEVVHYTGELAKKLGEKRIRYLHRDIVRYFKKYHRVLLMFMGIFVILTGEIRVIWERIKRKFRI